MTTDTVTHDSSPPTEPQDRAPEEPWATHLRDLLAGHYAGKGGRSALAVALNTPALTLASWLRVKTSVAARSPSYDARQRIKALWERHQPPAP